VQPINIEEEYVNNNDLEQSLDLTTSKNVTWRNFINVSAVFVACIFLCSLTVGCGSDSGTTQSTDSTALQLEKFAAETSLKTVLATGTKDDAMVLFKSFYEATPGIYSVQWIDANGVNRFGYPVENSLSDYDYKTSSSADDKNILQIVMNRKPAAYEALLFEGWTGVFGFQPVFMDGTYLGMVYSIKSKTPPSRIETASVSAGGLHTMILKPDGSLWATGANTNGQLGDGTTTDRSFPVRVMTGVKAVSAGENHTMIIKSDGTLWATGMNNVGQLGDGTTTDKSVPVQVMSGVKAVSAGVLHTMIIKNDDSLWGTGWNRKGMLGGGTTDNTSTPIKVMDGVRAVSAAYTHTMILKSDGSLWGAGGNSDGTLGDGTTVSTGFPVQVMGCGAGTVQAVSAGSTYTMILKSDGTLWATGANYNGERGDGGNDSISTPVQIMTGLKAVSASVNHTMILKIDGSLWGAGSDMNGELGAGALLFAGVPVQIVAKDVISVSAGGAHTVIVKADGSVWATGANSNGQLGNGKSGTDVYESIPVQIL
jgi:alpha-tubulin suppressor-like RCC1 family protein